MSQNRFSINILGILSGTVMFVAMLIPWWSFTLQVMGQTDLYPYLVDGPASEFLGYRRSPQMTILTVLLAVCILLCIVGSFLKGRRGRIMLAIAGALTFLAVWRFVARIADVAARFHLGIQGHGIGSLGGFAKVEVWTWIRPGLYLISIGALFAIIASLLASKLRLER
jgi:hypothetical protein